MSAEVEISCLNGTVEVQYENLHCSLGRSPVTANANAHYRTRNDQTHPSGGDSLGCSGNREWVAPWLLLLFRNSARRLEATYSRLFYPLWG